MSTSRGLWRVCASVVLVPVSIGLLGCVEPEPAPPPPTVWTKPGATNADYQRQIATCRNASTAIPAPVYNNGTGVGDALQNQGAMLGHYAVVFQYIHNCMVAAGWTERPQ
jgi:hypothetical protein